MKNLAVYSSNKHGIYFGPSKILGEARALHKAGTIPEATKAAWHDWNDALPKDDEGRPIKPDTGVETYQVDGELETQIEQYLKENGQDAIEEIVFDPETMTFTIEEDVKAARLALAESETKKVELATTDGPMTRGVEDLVALLITKGLITADDIPQPLADKIAAREVLRSEISS